MKSRLAIALILPGVLWSGAISAAPGAPDSTRTAEPLAPAQKKLLQNWYRTVGPRRTGETFGQLVARAAFYQRGRKYFAPKQIDQRAGRAERLKLKLNNFDCVSLIESSFALGRCLWQKSPTTSCFMNEVIASRFRGGQRGDYADRLHYFSEWLRDNGRRGRLRDLSATLGGRPFPRQMNYMSRHPQKYPAMRRAKIAQRIRQAEVNLSKTPPSVLGRAGISRSQKHLRDGDIVAIVTRLRGILVTHAGLVIRVRNQPRLLHASQFHKGVVLDGASIAHYVNRRPERLGVLLSRPLPPRAKNRP